jgi:transcriptional regulator with XRE-family HTH domain
MTQIHPPWDLLTKARERKDMTQAELAKGIVSQSMISQIEHGRIVPSPRTLQALAEKLSIDVDMFMKSWESLRKRDHVRERLWLAALADMEPTVTSLLKDFQFILHPFERQVYLALSDAFCRHPKSADMHLQGAWFPHADAKQSDVATPVVDTYGWTRMARQQALVIDAKARQLICRLTRRDTAAEYWEHRFFTRMQQLTRGRDVKHGKDCVLPSQFV